MLAEGMGDSAPRARGFRSRAGHTVPGLCTCAGVQYSSGAEALNAAVNKSQFCRPPDKVCARHPEYLKRYWPDVSHLADQ